jgi:phage-related protein (TIGR01555 family)
MRKLFRDALNSALTKLGFPFLTPHPTKTGKEVGYFQTKITDSDLYSMYKRNQLAHNIIINVAYDVFSSGFKCVTLEGEEDKEFNAEVQQIYERFVHYPLFKTYLQARLYGSAGLLIGFDDGNSFDKPTKDEAKISYLYSIPHEWVSYVAPEKDELNNITLPQKLAYYELKYLKTTSTKIDASRLVHIQPLSIEDNFEGESALYCIFDVLTVLKNMDWSTGQAMFRHGGGLTTVIPGDESTQDQIDLIDETVSEINTKTILTLLPGCKIQHDRPGALDPEKYYNVINAQACGGSNIPISILMGSQAGAVQASSKDRKDYADFLHAIQVNDLTPALIQIIKCFQASGQISKGHNIDDFLIQWNSPSIFIIDTARGKLYEARAEHERAKAEEKCVQTQLLQLKLSELQGGSNPDATST